jgi:hypothetical protein
MAYNISAFAGAGAQFFDSNGTPLAGGLLYVYTAGTTTPATTWTTSSGAVANTNPIVMNAAGRTPYEIWLNSGVTYKFALYTSTNVLIGTYDNIPAIDDPTVFNNLITVTGTNTLIGTSVPPYTSYVAGMTLSFIPANTNTGAVTIDVDGLGAKNIFVGSATALSSGDLVAGRIANLEYDGTRFQLYQSSIADGAVTYAKIQNVSAGKVLGRDTSGAGIVQELPISLDASGNASFVGTLNSVGNIDTNSRLLVGTRTASSGGGGNVQYRNDTGAVQWAAGVLGSAGSTDFNVYNVVASTHGLTIDTSANLKFNSGYGSVATAYGCRAWVNFNGSGTVAIRASGNVSSITDNGTGDYTVNFTTALTDANYALVGSGKIDDTNSDGNAPIVGLRRSTSPPTTTAARITTVSSVNVALDCTYVSVAIFR